MHPTRVLAVFLAGLAVCSVAAPAAAVAGSQPGRPALQQAGPCTGHITSQPDHLTVVSVQGARFGENGGKTAARVVAFEPDGSIAWVYHRARENGIVWSYDIDPLPNGNLFMVGTHRGTTVLAELNTETGERVWSRELDMVDTHDADMLGPHRIAIANMRNYDEETGRNNDRLVIYNRTSDEITDEWLFRNHYGRDIGGEYTDDWTHVNDVDRVSEHVFLLSPRNFDMSILVNVTSGEVVSELGSYGNHEVLHKQHNPDYLRGANGTPTLLVADSENERVVEYRLEGSTWTRTWTVGNASVLNWPRDADRLANGNTLISDSRNNRVVEVTPEGEVVWEVYAPWLVYDAERVPVDGSRGPTIAEQNETGTYALANATPPGTETLEACSQAITSFSGGFDETLTTATPATSADVDATAQPNWSEAPRDSDTSAISPPGLGVVAAGLVVLGALAVFAARRRLE